MFNFHWNGSITEQPVDYRDVNCSLQSMQPVGVGQWQLTMLLAALHVEIVLLLLTNTLR